jgi:hypothetical protein
MTTALPAAGKRTQSLNRYAYALNNPETLTDPMGLGPVQVNFCGSLKYGVGLGMCQTEVNGVIMAEQSLGDSWAADPFDVMSIPVVTQTWIPNSQVGTMLLGASSWGPVSPGYWSTTTVGNAFTMFGGQLAQPSGGGAGLGGTAQTLKNFGKQVPWAGSVNFPIPVVTPDGVMPGPGGPTISGAFNVPGSSSGCIGGGWWVGTPGERSVGGGPLLFGDLAKASNILSGPSWSFNVQGPPFIGFQVIWNSNGFLAGPTAGIVPGLALSRTISACH